MQRVWYGWHHLIVFGASASLVPVAVELEDGFLALASFSGFAVGGPIVHLAHGNVVKGLASFGLNVLCTMGGSFMATAAASGSHYDTIMTSMGVGVGFGLLTANLIDIAALAYDEPEPQSHPSIPQLAPQIRVAPGSATIGLGGIF